MAFVAHLSDFHLLEPNHEARTPCERFRLRFLSFGRELDAPSREQRVARALATVADARPDHVCITGDLTEDGTEAQFEVLARLLAESGIPAERVTLVPGNHDAYHDAAAFTRALEGPLRAFRRTSRAGTVTELRDAAVVAVDSTIAQHYVRAAGAVTPAQLDHLHTLARSSLRDRAVVVAQHHPPMRHLLPGGQWVAGLLTHQSMRSLLEAHEHVHVLHGHIHRRVDRPVAPARRPQSFSVSAVVDGEIPVRFYSVSDGHVRAASEAPPPPAFELAAAAG